MTCFSEHEAKVAVIRIMATLRGCATSMLDLLGDTLLQHRSEETVTSILTRNVAAQTEFSIVSLFHRMFALLSVLTTLYAAFLTLFALSL